jgi:hypothetical protein
MLGIVYFDPDDPRMAVPRRDKLGWYLNFGHARAVTAVAWIFGVGLCALLVAPIIAHPRWFAQEPTDIVWWSLATLTAVGIVRFNKWFAWSDYRQISLAFFGILAGIGFGIQALINGPLVLWWGNKFSWPHYLVLASVAAAAQTFGKWFALSILLKARPPASPAQCFRCGLLIGLGFTVLEITFVYFKVAWAQVPVGYLSLWERANASMFHIYSAGMVAMAIGSRRNWPILLVFVLHALMDFLAGGGGAFGLSLYGLESLFSAIAIVVWVVSMFAVRDSRTAAC